MLSLPVCKLLSHLASLMASRYGLWIFLRSRIRGATWKQRIQLGFNILTLPQLACWGWDPLYSTKMTGEIMQHWLGSLEVCRIAATRRHDQIGKLFRGLIRIGYADLIALRPRATSYRARREAVLGLKRTNKRRPFAAKAYMMWKSRIIEKIWSLLVVPHDSAKRPWANKMALFRPVGVARRAAPPKHPKPRWEVHGPKHGPIGAGW